VTVHDRTINQTAPSGRLRPCPLARGNARPFGRWQHPAGRTPKCTRRKIAEQSAHGSMAVRLVVRTRAVAKSTLTNLAFSWKGQQPPRSSLMGFTQTSGVRTQSILTVARRALETTYWHSRLTRPAFVLPVCDN